MLKYKQSILFLMCWVICQPTWSGTFLGSNFIEFGAVASNPASITHPPGYDGTGGELVVSFCLQPDTDNPFLAQAEVPAQNAATIWNDLIAVTSNTTGSQDDFSGRATLDAESEIIHALGHGLGLDHSNIFSELGRFEGTSAFINYTAVTRGANDVFNFALGADNLAGTGDDVRGDDVNRFWFRREDNNPFLIGAMIDRSTYSVDLADLPAGDLFAANANSNASFFAGLPLTESVMHETRTVDRMLRFQRSLSADDVATLRLGMAGLDERQGTGDDYTVRVEYIGITNDCDIRLNFNLSARVPTSGMPDVDHIFNINLEQVAGSTHTVVSSGAELSLSDPVNAAGWLFNTVLLESTTPEPNIDNPSGSWLSPGRDGEGWVIEKLSDEVAGFYWFTYPPEGNEGDQQWLLGIGEIDGNRFTFDNVQITSGAIFGNEFDPGDVVRETWGTIEFEFSDDSTGSIMYSGPPEFGTGLLDIVRFVELDSSAETEVLPTGISGSWFDSETDGEGWVIEVISATQAVIYWFTYDENGNQAWNGGVAQIVDNTLVLENSVDTAGTSFGDGFDIDAVQRSFFGTLLFEFEDCGNGTLTYSSVLDDGGVRDIRRLTNIEGFECGAF